MSTLHADWPEGPLLTVVGNCQAESLRLLLDPTGEHSVRLPAVFELEDADLPALRRALARTDVLVSQPVRDDYRGLPLGTSQLAALLPASARVVVVPILRWSGLHPFHVVHHPPTGTPGPVLEPPVVPYHDLRLVRAAVAPGATPPAHPSPDAVRAVGDASRHELARREQATDVAVSSLLVQPQADDLRTLNHPGNRLLLALTARVAELLDRPAPVDPRRRLLDSVLAPLEPVVAEAWDLGDDAVRDGWRVEGRDVGVDEVAAHHLEWYAAHPGVAAEVWGRFAGTARLLGLDRGLAA